MAFNVKGAKDTETKERVNFNIDANGWDVSNVRVVSPYMISFTLKMHGLALYNMKVTEAQKGEHAGERFLSNGQSKGNDGKYYNNYALYLSDEDTQAVIAAVVRIAETGTDDN